MRDTAVLLLKQHRFAVSSVIIACIAIALGTLIVTLRLGSFAFPSACFDDPDLRSTSLCLGAEEFFRIQREYGGQLLGAAGLLPFIAGILLGVPLVAAEVETQTATIAWSLSGSRRWLLLRRMVIFGVLMTALLAVVGIASHQLSAARMPQVDISTDPLRDYGTRGALVVSRGLVVFVIATLIGLAVGRVLPALIISAVISAMLFIALSDARFDGWPTPEYVVERPGARVFSVLQGDTLSTAYADQNGDRVTFDEIVEAAPMPPGDPGFDPWLADNYQTLVYGVPGEKLAFVEQREMAGTALAIPVLLAVSLVVVEKRRPY
jgi:hypothetical protein